jgi:hypothetical protein
MQKYINGVLVDMTEEDIAWYASARAAAEKEDIKQKTQSAREKRDKLLRLNVDSLNPIRWAALTDEQKASWSVYRQALLDVPQQPGFPHNVIWPEKPAS